VIAFQAAAALYALYLLVRHVPRARQGSRVSCAASLAAGAVLVMALRALLAAARPLP
jgi:hypothetical protein